MADGVVENIVKQGYLRRTNTSSNRFSGLFKRQEGTKWFVLVVRQNSPYLQQYDADVDVFSRTPIHSYSLAECKAVRSMGSSNPPMFCVVCPDRVIELIAASRTQMLEWVSTVETCLTDLGVIKNEPVEHVYTVCPAVVRKPRVSKEVLEEREAEALMLIASDDVPSTPAPPIPSVSQSNESEPYSPYNNVASSALPWPRDSRRASSPVEVSAIESPPRVPARSKTLKQTSTTSPPKISCAQDREMEINAANVIDHLPPPLPSRSKSNAVSTGSLLSPLYSANPLIHPITGSSNDSDFVSPEVIAQLRSERTNIGEPQVPSLSPVEGSDGSSVSLFLSSNTTSNMRKNEASASSPSARKNAFSKVGSLSSQKSAEDWENKSHSSSSPFSSFSSPTPSPELEQLLEISINTSAPSTHENDYSTLPSHSGACSLPKKVSEMACTNVSATISSSSDYSRPIPRSRHAFTRQDCLQDELHPSEVFDSDTYSKSNGLYDNNLRACILNESEENGAAFGDAVERQDQDKLKDENENCYGLVFEYPIPCVPSNMPIPCIPPLPPRHDSLLEAPHSPISFHETHTSFVKSKEVNAPPLPLPRRNTSHARYGASNRMSSPTASQNLEIPPMPPRRQSPLTSKALSHDNRDNKFDEDNPPALPSRPSQSFYIKRPQLTPQCNSKSDSSESQAAAESHASETACSQSGLSRMMLLDRAHSLHTVVSLKQTQAEILQSEISMPSVALTLTQKSGHGLALVEWNSLPCVVGWNQRDFPSLHGKLHLGDQLISVNGVKVTTVDVAQKLLKGATTPKITMVLHRMPYAKVFAIRRDAEGQSLGIKREGGSGEIVYVDPNGLAAQHGLTAYALGVISEIRCNWFITEINNRPISLFFKENEIEHRLAAVGREISIVVQPSDFIHEIRKQFKKLKNYKNYIAQ